MPDKEKVIKELEGLRDICNAKSNMAIGKGKIAWAGHANAVDDALALLKKQPEIVRCHNCKYFMKGIPVENMCRLHHEPSSENWFCADGESR